MKTSQTNSTDPEGRNQRRKVSASFKVGAIALAFLIIGYQAALLIHSASVARIAAVRSTPDTVYIVEKILADSSRSESITIRKQASTSAREKHIYEASGLKRVESFVFNPNTVSVEDLQRLGFSEKQAQSIESYRIAGGQFRRPEDFAKSYVVADSVFERLKPFIRIPLTDINSADSAAFDALPGIGPYYAAQMIQYREKLGGYSFPEQLMDLHNFTQEKFDALSDLIEVGPCEPYPIWTLSEDELENHPYIGKYGAHGVVLYRENNEREALTVEGLAAAGVLRPLDAERLARCRLAEP